MRVVSVRPWVLVSLVSACDSSPMVGAESPDGATRDAPTVDVRVSADEDVPALSRDVPAPPEDVPAPFDQPPPRPDDGSIPAGDAGSPEVIVDATVDAFDASDACVAWLRRKVTRLRGRERRE